LLVVDTKTVAMGIRVGEEPRLEDGICRGLDVGDEMRRRESGLRSFIMRINESSSEKGYIITCSISAK